MILNILKKVGAPTRYDDKIQSSQDIEKKKRVHVQVGLESLYNCTQRKKGNKFQLELDKALIVKFE